MNADIINWKKLVQCKGYKSLKYSYFRRRGWENYYKGVFGALKKVCFHHNLDPCKVLDKWEEERNYSFANWYNQSKRRLEELALSTKQQ